MAPAPGVVQVLEQPPTGQVIEAVAVEAPPEEEEAPPLGFDVPQVEEQPEAVTEPVLDPMAMAMRAAELTALYSGSDYPKKALVDLLDDDAPDFDYSAKTPKAEMVQALVRAHIAKEFAIG